MSLFHETFVFIVEQLKMNIFPLNLYLKNHILSMQLHVHKYIFITKNR
jgi:hypothetical protein